MKRTSFERFWPIFLKRSLSDKTNWLFYECIIDSVHDVDKQSFFLKDNNTVTERFEKKQQILIWQFDNLVLKVFKVHTYIVSPLCQTSQLPGYPKQKLINFSILSCWIRYMGKDVIFIYMLVNHSLIQYLPLGSTWLNKAHYI